MKKLSVIAVLVALAVWSCSSEPRRDTGRVYMPDMAYSRAVETYSDLDTLQHQGINYNAVPVAGTIKRGEMFPFALAKDKAGDTTNYAASKQVADPLTRLSETQLVEAERLYLVNCGICHGKALDGMGPLKKRPDGSEGPYPAQPANLMGGLYLKMPAGQMYYSVTYGKGQMGSYASQLSTTQRWMVVQYVKNKQAEANSGTTDAAAATTTTAAADSTAKK
jgi:mono/diheme cytochrome c family protein